MVSGPLYNITSMDHSSPRDLLAWDMGHHDTYQSPPWQQTVSHTHAFSLHIVFSLGCTLGQSEENKQNSGYNNNNEDNSNSNNFNNSNNSNIKKPSKTDPPTDNLLLIRLFPPCFSSIHLSVKYVLSLFRCECLFLFEWNYICIFVFITKFFRVPPLSTPSHLSTCFSLLRNWATRL